MAAAQTAADILPWLIDIYEKEKGNFSNYSESQLEDHWFKPIFAKLGHIHEGQASVPGLSKGTKFPDYVFFPDEEGRSTAVGLQRSSEYAQQALAVGEVKAWDIPLGRKAQGTPSFANNNPSYQIDYYLRATDLSWGILSNGRKWRLIHKDSSYKLDVFFEIDLIQGIENAIASGKRSAELVFFVCFFQQSSMMPDGAGRTFLDDALESSASYALRLENDLRDNAYKALEALIQGFIEPQANRLSADDLPLIYTNSLYLLYRIIFLFYGEARGLLPIENAEYQSYSITQFARTIATDLDSGRKAAPMTNQSWNRLKQLFTIIAGTQPDLNEHLNVPRYNGGLFNPELHPFLENHFVGDRYLHAAIDAIARREVGDKKTEFKKENVDYRTLGVRQLGSIYEGLLEYQPQRASEPMKAVKKGKSEEWIPAGAVTAKMKVLDERGEGDVYLVTDKGERKATGSYYTPDYIVKYIVEQTLGPLVDQVRERVKADKSGPTFAKEILKLDVLDPAMGSGHFLVEATDYLARAIATDDYVTIEDAKTIELGDDDLVYWRRQVVEACIYGVDKNPMAVELAKLSLWLVTVAKDRPLSFLDHHLLHGDSLVGARLADLKSLPQPKKKGKKGAEEAPQMALLDETALAQDAFKAVEGMMTIETVLSDSIDEIHRKADLFADAQSQLEKWQTLADLWTSSFFGNTMTPEEYADLARHIQGEGGMLSPVQRNQFLNHATMQENDYFHWELSFPEVFFNRDGNSKGEMAGFDGIIGNPPYVRQELLGYLKPMLSVVFPKIYSGVADLYVYFLGISEFLLRKNGRLGFITSGTFRKLNFGSGIRNFLATKMTIDQLVDFGDSQVFEGAITYPIVLIYSNSKNIDPENNHFKLIKASDSVKNKIVGTVEYSESPMIDQDWVFLDAKLKQKIFSPHDSKSLSQWVNSSIFRGVTTGNNNAFIITDEAKSKIEQDDPDSGKIIKRYIRGEDISSWSITEPRLWLIFTRRGVEIDEFQGVKKYLQKFRVNLEPRPKLWDKSQKWEGRKPGKYKWFEIQDSVNYFEAFESFKIFSTKVSRKPSFAISTQPTYSSNTTYVINPPTEEVGLYLIAFLNSKISNFYARLVFSEKANGYYEVQPDKLGDFKIPSSNEASFKTVVELSDNLTRVHAKRNSFSEKMKNRIVADLGIHESSLSKKLSTWWVLDFKTFRAEIKKVFKKDIPLAERDDWEEYLADQTVKHQALTDQIIALEIELNDIVYGLFELTQEEIQIIEESTKYKYGEV